MSIKSPLFLLIAASTFLGDNFVTATTCSDYVDHSIYALGREVNITVRTFYDPSYGTMQVEFGPDAGIYSNAIASGYCVDFERLVGTANYTTDTYSTYDLKNIPVGAVDKPENLDMLNWMVNEYPIGTKVGPLSAQCPETEITWKHIQTAAWQIVDTTKVASDMFGTLPCIVNYIVGQAFQNGDGFEPCCDNDQKIAAMLVIDDDSVGGATTGNITNQVMIIEMPLSQLSGACPTPPPEPADTCFDQVDHSVFALSREVNITVRTFYDPSYGTMQVEFGPDAGIYSNTNASGYCVDFERLVGTANYTADTYSTYDLKLIPDGAVDKPENLDMLNWMVNEYPIGTKVGPLSAQCPETEITWKHIQIAAWQIVDTTIVASNMFGALPCIVDYIVEQAFQNGDGFEPCCDNDQKIAAMLVIDDDTVGGATTGTITNQVMIIEMPLSQLSGACSPPPPPEPFDTQPVDTGAKGDPHLTTWAGDTYDFHGVCDLVLLQNFAYKSGLGMDIHIRTRKTRRWSYISAAIIRIGDETLEVRGGKENSYWVNGNAGNGDFIGLTISGHAINFRNPNKKSREFEIDLGDRDSIVIKTWHEMVSVNVKNYSSEKFTSSLGLLGSYPDGIRLARDNQTIVEDENDFGQEWQVLATEKNLFHNIEGPQAPLRCDIPSKNALRRRLSSSMLTTKAAEYACEHIKDKREFELCVFDVMATNDEEVAEVY